MKRRSEYNKSKSAHDGVFPYCKDCVSALNKDRYKKIKADQKKRRDDLKAEVLSLLGGSCVRCGYDDFASALDFHHEYGGKEAVVAKLLTNARYRNDDAVEILMAEAQKCIVLCSNCHRGLHSGDWEIECEAKDEQHAVKIANEKRIQALAEGRWPESAD